MTMNVNDVLDFDTLETIFIHCVDKENPHPTRELVLRPVRLSQVCQSWRAAVLEMPALWDNLRVGLDARRTTSYLKPDPSLVSLWLGRARNRPLTVSVIARPITNHRARPDVYFAIFSRVFKEVLQFRDQLHTLSIDLSTFFTPAIFHTIFDSSETLRSLQNVDLSFPHHFEHIAACLEQLFRTVPLLASFTVSGPHHVGNNLHRPNFAVSLPNLLHLRLDVAILSPENAFDLLRGAPNLITWRCHIKGWSAPPSLHPIRLEYVTIYVQEIQEPRLTGFLDLLELPSLASFSFQGHYSFPPAEFLSLVQHSSCSLERLRIEGSHITDREVLSCLEAVSLSLKELDIVDARSCITSRVLSALTATQTGNYLCPFLEEVKLGGDEFEGAEDGLVAQMLTSRYGLAIGESELKLPFWASRLKRVDIFVSSPHHILDRIRLTKLHEEGLENSAIMRRSPI